MGERFRGPVELFEHELCREPVLVDVEQDEVRDPLVEALHHAQHLLGGAEVDEALFGQLHPDRARGVLAGGQRALPPIPVGDVEDHPCIMTHDAVPAGP